MNPELQGVSKPQTGEDFFDDAIAADDTAATEDDSD